VDRETLTRRIYAVLAANGMHDGVHVRLMVSRGVKATPYQDPRMTVTPPTIVIIPEYKAPLPETLERGVTLFTVHVRRGYSDVQDPTLNTHSKLNCITACIQAAKAGCDEALMLDPHGFVATCNSTHFFIVRRGELWTSTGNYCLDGITRRKVLTIAAEEGMTVRERNFTLTDVYNAEEAFVTGTFAGLSPVREVDGRTIGDGRRGPIVASLQSAYRQRVAAYIDGPGRAHARS
jgi:branched-chain amino acid aminotransferase